MSSQDRIAVATRHVENGRRIVARQREMVAEGKLGLAGIELLAAFERSQEIFEADLADLLSTK